MFTFSFLKKAADFGPTGFTYFSIVVGFSSIAWVTILIKSLRDAKALRFPLQEPL